ncbi:DivIVA domain-containing protein [Gordonia sp. (in: high G+C Gram-positive bacteria)]|uniref:DivIVA domain-containing protein n=1 Tax=Gordonia sp. (in: high G+C Gram-positive bacteria) TaxID=84139 RepID=UPI00169E59D8|nr:DivIVA domain-containing protein [Gordonia sp. (in: high G+C Gram-positive bacteria)]NLG44864.1 DivIVA domain-containing protein [Gordonia sp. (in: high G+C Gram-positive bacteria)]
MVTIGLYVIGVAVLVALLFALVWFVFGRGEEMPPIEKGTTLTRLPRAGITGDDVRTVVFQQVFRGYKASEVDWTLEKLAREIDELRAVVHDLAARDELDAGKADTGPMRPLGAPGEHDARH